MDQVQRLAVAADDRKAPAPVGDDNERSERVLRGGEIFGARLEVGGLDGERGADVVVGLGGVEPGSTEINSTKPR